MKSSCSLLRAIIATGFIAFSLFAPRVVAADSPAVAPTPGRELVATAVSSTEIVLTWTPTSHDFTYTITRAGPDGQPHSLGSVGQTSSFHDRALEPDTTYSYLIRASSGNAAADQFMMATAHTAAWQDQDIGQVGAAGSVSRAGDFIAVIGSGADIDGSADAFHFVHQPWSGDGELIVRVNSVANTAPWAKAGIMFRESLAAGARFVMLAANPAGNSALLARSTSDGPTQTNISAYSDTPQWLKLVRQGSTFEAFQSRDGVRWGSVGSITVDLPANVYAGLAVTSHAAGTPCAAVFDGFNLSMPWDTGASTAVSPTTNSGISRIDVDWSNVYSASYLVEISLDNFRTALPTPRVGFQSYYVNIYDLEPGTTYYIKVRPIYADGLGLSSPILTATTRPAPPGATKPAAPTSLSANAVSSTQVNLMWADNSNNETNFIVESSTDGWTFAAVAQAPANTTSLAVQNLVPNTTYHFRVRALYGVIYNNDYATLYSGYSNLAAATTFLTPTGSPYAVVQPASLSLALGTGHVLSTRADGGPNSYRWLHNGIVLPDSNPADYSYGDYYGLKAIQPGDTGIYSATITNAGGSVETDPAIVGLTMTGKVAGAAHVVGNDIHHPNGNIYDQVLLDGTAASITADPNQVTRISYVDLNDDIVQVEFSGAGTLSIALDDASGPAPAQKYNQPDVSYMKGHATIVIAGADESTNVSIFSVGSANAVNQSLFRDGVSYDGIADVAALAIISTNGRFGGVFAGDAHFFGTRSLTGIFAPNVEFAGRVTVHDITSHDDATPMLMLGQATDVRVAGGSLAQPTGRPVQVGMFSALQFVAGTKSDGSPLPAQTVQGRLEQNGSDVTTQITARSAP